MHHSFGRRDIFRECSLMGTWTWVFMVGLIVGIGGCAISHHWGESMASVVGHKYVPMSISLSLVSSMFIGDVLMCQFYGCSRLKRIMRGMGKKSALEMKRYLRLSQVISLVGLLLLVFVLIMVLDEWKAIEWGFLKSISNQKNWIVWTAVFILLVGALGWLNKRSFCNRWNGFLASHPRSNVERLMKMDGCVTKCRAVSTFLLMFTLVVGMCIFFGVFFWRKEALNFLGVNTSNQNLQISKPEGLWMVVSVVVIMFLLGFHYFSYFYKDQRVFLRIINGYIIPNSCGKSIISARNRLHSMSIMQWVMLLLWMGLVLLLSAVVEGSPVASAIKENQHLQNTIKLAIVCDLAAMILIVPQLFICGWESSKHLRLCQMEVHNQYSSDFSFLDENCLSW